MTMYKVLHPRYEFDRLYLTWKKGGRRLARIENSVHTSIQRLEGNTEQHEGLITATRIDTDNMKTNKIKLTRKKWEKKPNYMGVLND